MSKALLDRSERVGRLLRVHKARLPLAPADLNLETNLLLTERTRGERVWANLTGGRLIEKSRRRTPLTKTDLLLLLLLLLDRNLRKPLSLQGWSG